MADEELAIAPTEQATPAIEPEQSTEPAVPADEPEIIPEPGEELDTGEAEVPEIEVVEIEWDDGKKYQIPKALEGGLLRNKDYTQKSQSNSDKAKALQAKEAEIAQRLEATEDELNARAELTVLNKQLAEYDKLTPEDWQAHSDTDPKGTGDAWRHYQFLQSQKAALAQKVSGAQAERTQKAEQDLATRVEETIQFAQKEIPGWKPELTPTLVKHALDLGVPEAAIKANWSPVLYKLLHQAHIGSIALQKQATAPKLPAAPVTPLSTVGGKSSPGSRGDLSSMSMEDYVAARKKGVGGKALR